MAGKNTEVARLFCSLNKMQVEDGLPPNRTKADATRWGCRVAWDHLKDAVEPPPRDRPPMAVKGGPGDTLQVAMDLHVDQVRSAVRNSGKCPVLEYWVGRLAPDALQTATVWMNLPEETRETTANLWTMLQAALWLVYLRLTGG